MIARKAAIAALLYVAMLPGANEAAAQAVPDGIAALQEGTLRKLVLHQAPKPVGEVVFTSPDGTEHRLSDFQGKTVLLNFWATWCAPCRKEMPALNALEADYGGDAFAVVTIATGRNRLEAIEAFNDEHGIDRLATYLDPKSALARAMTVFGLPTTVVLNPAGEEIARMQGDAEWDGNSGRAVIEALIAAYSG